MSVVVRYPATHETAELQLAAVFLLIGPRPNTAFLNASVDVDEARFLLLQRLVGELALADVRCPCCCSAPGLRHRSDILESLKRAIGLIRGRG